MVGAVAIVLLISIGLGVQRELRSEVEDLGVNVLIVLPGRVEQNMFNPNLGGQSYLQPDDAARVRRVPGVREAALLTFVGGGIRAGEKTAYPFLIAAEPSWFRVRPVKLDAGRTFTEAEETQDVAVIGSIAKEELFGEQDAIGQKVTINGRSYTVVGVTRDRSSENSLFSMGSFENIVYIPYAALRRVDPNAQTHRIMVQSRPEVEPKALVASVDAALGRRLEREQYSVLTQEDLLGLIYRVMNILSYLLIGLTSIALFVGGVGIMTVMLMSVNERSREIGLRKAVGARNRDIFQQFIVEAAVIGLVGGVIGLALSVAVATGLATWTPIKPLITSAVVAVCFGVSVGVGALFGLIPALKASRRDPVTSLRGE